MRAHIDRPTGDEQGVLVAWGTSNTGLTWYLQDGDIVFDYNLFGTHHVVRAAAPGAGAAVAVVEFVRNDDGAAITVGFDGAAATETIQVPWVLRFIGMSGMDVGRDAGSAISDAYEGPYPFTGGFTSLEIDVTEELDPAEIFKRDREKVRRALAQQ